MQDVCYFSHRHSRGLSVPARFDSDQNKHLAVSGQSNCRACPGQGVPRTIIGVVRIRSQLAARVFLILYTGIVTTPLVMICAEPASVFHSNDVPSSHLTIEA